MKLRLLFLLLLAGSASAQVSTIRSVSSLPATCNPGGGAGGAPQDVVSVWNGSTSTQYNCTALNTWSSGTGSGNVALGTAGQVAYYPSSTNGVAGDVCSTDGSGHMTCQTLGANSITVSGAGAGAIDFTTGTGVGNPSAGKVRLYGNSNSGLITCLTSAGANCMGLPFADVRNFTLGSSTGGIQEAINSLSSGGVVFLPCGTYVPSVGITVSNPVSIVGAGRACVLIQPASNPSFDVVTITSNNVSMSHLQVDGNASGETAFSSIVLTNGSSSISNINFDDVKASGAGNYCIGWNNSSGAPSNLNVVNSIIIGCAKRTLYGNWGAANTTAGSNYIIRGNTFNTTSVPAINPTPSGFWGDIDFTVGGAAAVTNIVIADNFIFYPVYANSQESDGIVLSTGNAVGASITQVTVANNVITGPTGTTPLSGHGLEMWGVSGAAVSGNYFGPNLNPLLLQASTASGILCNASITGNSFIMPLSGINIGTLSPGCQATFSGNYLDVFGGDGIQVGGSGITVSGNSFKAHSNLDIPIHLKCQESGGCTSDSVTGNVIHEFSGSRGIYSDSPNAFKNLNVTGNAMDGGGTGIEWAVTGDLGFISSNTFSGITRSYRSIPNGMAFIDGTVTTGSCTGTASSSQTLGLYGTGPNQTTTTCTSTTIGAGIPMNHPGNIGYLRATATHAGVSVSSGVVTVLKNGSTTSSTCTIGTGTSCEDNVHGVAFVAGDLISIQFTTQATEVLAGVNAVVVEIN